MKFQQFQSSIYSAVAGADVKRQSLYYGSAIVETVDGTVLIDRVETQFSCLEEASEYLKQQKLQEEIQRDIQQELYEEMSDNKIADIIRQYHSGIRVTDTLIESYVELASSKIFTADPVAQEIRKFNKLDRLIEGRLDYTLNDGTTIIISEDAQEKINNLFGQHDDIISYMRTSQKAFLSVLNQIEE